MAKQSRGLILKAGGVRIEVEYRRRGSDGGLSFDVYGGDENTAPEVLRFDCFEKRPHFHYLGPSRNRLVRMDKKTTPDPVKWTLRQLKKDLSSMVWKAGHRRLAKEINQAAVARAVSKAEEELIRLSTGK